MATATAATDPAGPLREVVGAFFEVDPGEVGPSFPIATGRGAGSLARATLDAAIRRRLGLRCPSVYTARTFADLVAGLDGTAPPAAPEASTGSTPAPTLAVAPMAGLGLSCGVDLERVDALPEASDYWVEPFYLAHFTPSEIAYCVRQAEPRAHFAGRWCLKEALRKADPAFLTTPMTEVEVDASGGAPRLRVVATGRPLPHAVSLSHTSDQAIAVVIRPGLGLSPAPGPDDRGEIAQAPAGPPVEAPRGRRSPLGLAAQALAIGLAAWALARSYGLVR